MKIRSLLLPFLSLGCLATSTPAALLVYEGFDYTIGEDTLLAANGGTGFGGGYTANGAATTHGDITAPTLSYTDSGGRALNTSGNQVLMDTTVNFRSMTGLNAGATAGLTTLYFSLLGQQTVGTGRATNFAFFGGTGSLVTGEIFSLGHGTGINKDGASQPIAADYQWGVFTNGNGANGDTTDPTPYSNVSMLTAPAFAVLRVDLNGGANGTDDRFRLYVNPSLDAEPAVADVEILNGRNVLAAFSDIQSIRPFSATGNAAYPAGSEATYDELRIGTTWADVTPFTVVPEPGSAGLAALAALGLLRRRRR
jgi:MYXO-CTERM domain-containing protein